MKTSCTSPSLLSVLYIGTSESYDTDWFLGIHCLTTSLCRVVTQHVPNYYSMPLLVLAQGS